MHSYNPYIQPLCQQQWQGQEVEVVFQSDYLVSLHISKLDCLLVPINYCLRQPVAISILWDSL